MSGDYRGSLSERRVAVDLRQRYLFATTCCAIFITGSRTLLRRTSFRAGWAQRRWRWGSAFVLVRRSYTSYEGGGEIRRIAGRKSPPTAVATAAPLSGPCAAAVRFTGDASSDPTATRSRSTGTRRRHRARVTANASTPMPRVTVYRHADRAGRARGECGRDVAHRRGQSAAAAVNRCTIDIRAVCCRPDHLAARERDRSRRWHTTGHEPLVARDPPSQHPHTSICGPDNGRDAGHTSPAPEDLAATTTSYLELELTATTVRARKGDQSESSAAARAGVVSRRSRPARL